jgi:hypothetical protein
MEAEVTDEAPVGEPEPGESPAEETT